MSNEATPSLNKGFSLLELMIAMAIGLLIVALLITVYTRAAATSAEFQRTNSQIENGRFALQLMQQDITHAGFWGGYPIAGKPVVMGAPTAIVDPCTAWPGNADETINRAWATNVLSQPVLGYQNGVPSGGCVADTSRQAGTDVLVLRYAATCEAGVGDCAATGGDLYLQVSLCSTQPATAAYYFGKADPIVGAPGTADSTTLDIPKQRNCVTDAIKRKYVSNIYWVRNDATLMRTTREGGASASSEPLVENIEDLQVEYVLDTDSNGVADSDYITCSSCTAAQWNQVVAVRLSVLARGSAPSPGYSDTKTYTLGGAAAICSTAGSCTNKLLDPKYKRHVYSMVVRLVNPSARKGNAL